MPIDEDVHGLDGHACSHGSGPSHGHTDERRYRTAYTCGHGHVQKHADMSTPTTIDIPKNMRKDVHTDMCTSSHNQVGAEAPDGPSRTMSASSVAANISWHTSERACCDN